MHVMRAAAGVIVLFGLAAGDLAAQDRPAPAAELSAGWVGFADDGIVSEALVGGAARWYLSPRIAIGPEVVYIAGENHSHVVITGNLTFDLAAPMDGRPRQVTPYLVAGGGLFQTRESFPNNESFTSSEGAFTAGGGIRALAGDVMTFGVEARIGWEMHVRVNGLIGFRFGGNRLYP